MNHYFYSIYSFNIEKLGIIVSVRGFGFGA